MGVPGRDALGDAGRPLSAPLPPEAPPAATSRPAAPFDQVPAARLLRLRRLLPDGPGRRRRLPGLALQPRGRREDAPLLRAALALRSEGARRPRRPLRRHSLLLVPLPLPLRRPPRGALASLPAQGHPARALLHRLRPLHDGLPVPPARGPARARALRRVLRLPVLRRRLPGDPRPAGRDPGAVAPRRTARGLRRPRRGALRRRYPPGAGHRALEERRSRKRSTRAASVRSIPPRTPTTRAACPPARSGKRPRRTRRPQRARRPGRATIHPGRTLPPARSRPPPGQGGESLGAHRRRGLGRAGRRRHAAPAALRRLPPRRGGPPAAPRRGRGEHRDPAAARRPRRRAGRPGRRGCRGGVAAREAAGGGHRRLGGLPRARRQHALGRPRGPRRANARSSTSTAAARPSRRRGSPRSRPTPSTCAAATST